MKGQSLSETVRPKVRSGVCLCVSQTIFISTCLVHVCLYSLFVSPLEISLQSTLCDDFDDMSVH